MSRTTRQHRIAAAAATRRWRHRQAKGIRMVTVEVSEARLAQMVAEGLVPAAAMEDSVRLSAVLSHIIAQGTDFSAPVIDHHQRQTRGGQGREHGNGSRDKQVSSPGLRCGAAVVPPQVKHPKFPGRDIRGRWLKGTCGYPPIGAFDTASRE